MTEHIARPGVRTTLTVAPPGQAPPHTRLLHLADLQVRAAGEDGVPAGACGTFDGYACRFDVQDSYGTTWLAGCFERGGLDGDPYPLLWMHNPYIVLGGFTATEDNQGLRIAGWWDDTAEGRDARQRAGTGSAPELSVGFRDILFADEQETQIQAAVLQETSQVTLRMAAVPGSVLTGVRAQREAQEQARARAKAAHARLRLAGL